MISVNLQQPVKTDHRHDGSLLVHSIFLTIQGEGPNVGQPSVFVRLAGCNLQCPACDTQYTEPALRMSPDHILRDIVDTHKHLKANPLIVITGGEPLRQNLVPFINLAYSLDYRVQIETNGTCGIDKTALSDRARYDLQIVVSPKAGKVVLSLHEFIVAYKYVLDAEHIDPEDGLPTTVLGLPGKPARPHQGYYKKIYLQPADEYNNDRNRLNLDMAIQSCTYFGYTLCLQTHKMIGLP